MTQAMTLVRAGVVITDPSAVPGYIVDGAVLVDGTRIAAIGPFAELRAGFPDVPIVGGADDIVLPGLVNAHDHGRGLSPLGFGIEDAPLEAWILSLSRMPSLDPRRDTALSALKQLRGGISSTVNSHYHPTCSAQALESILNGYEDGGIRASVILSAMDRPITATLLRCLEGRLSRQGREDMERVLNRRVPFDTKRFLEVTREHRNLPGYRRSRLMTGVVSAHWSSDELLTLVDDNARRLGLFAQMHLLESRFQADGDPSIVRRLATLGVLGPHLSCAHCVHLTADDMGVMAEHGVSVVHNLSSNLRLRNGVAPVVAMLDSGVNVALGLDSMGINEDADLFQEMRLVHRVHGALDSRTVLTMATVNGARALGVASDVGTLSEGKRADLLVLNGARMVAPGLREPGRVFERVVYYATPDAVRSLFVDGRELIRDGRHVTLSEEALTADLIAGATESVRSDPALDRLVAEAVPLLRDLTRGEGRSHA